MDEKWEKIYRTYIESLGQYRVELNSLSATLFESAAENVQVVERIRQIAHKLAGSGAIYGLHFLSECALKLERLTYDEDATESDLIVHIKVLVDTLSEAIDNPHKPSSDFGDKPSAELHSLNILLVEDDDQLAILTEFFRSMNCNVHQVKSLQNLKSALTHASYDLIVCDLELDGNTLGGADYLTALRDEVNQSDIIFTSIHSDFQARLAAVRAGAKGFIEKPVSIKALKSLIKRLQKEKAPLDKTVLVVEDDPAQVTRYTSALRSAGLKTLEATCPEHAYKIMQQNKVDMIITDVHLPKSTGIEFAQVIKHDLALNPEVVILFMSTDTSGDTKLAALEVAADEFISKPIEPWRLVLIAESRLRKFKC